MEKIRKGLCDAVNLVSRGATTADADDDDDGGWAVQTHWQGKTRHRGRQRHEVVS